MPILSNPLAVATAAAEARKYLTMIRTGIEWYRARGVSRERLEEILDLAEADGRDISDIEFAELSGGAADEIARLNEEIAARAEFEDQDELYLQPPNEPA